MDRLHPLTKLAMLMAMTLAAFSAGSVWVTGLFFVLGGVAVIWRKKLPGGFWGIAVFHRRMLFVTPFVFPMFWLIAGDVGTGTWLAVVFLCRLGILIISALIFVGATGQDQLIRGLVMMRLPHNLAFMITVAIRFAPVLMREFKDVLDAQRARCYRIRPGNIQALVIPAALLLLKRSHEVTLAMWTKGYRGKLTYGSGGLEFQWLDAGIILLATVTGGAAVLL